MKDEEETEKEIVAVKEEDVSTEEKSPVPAADENALNATEKDDAIPQSMPEDKLVTPVKESSPDEITAPKSSGVKSVINRFEFVKEESFRRTTSSASGSSENSFEEPRKAFVPTKSRRLDKSKYSMFNNAGSPEPSGYKKPGQTPYRRKKLQSKFLGNSNAGATPGSPVPAWKTPKKEEEKPLATPVVKERESEEEIKPFIDETPRVSVKELTKKLSSGAEEETDATDTQAPVVEETKEPKEPVLDNVKEETAEKDVVEEDTEPEKPEKLGDDVVKDKTTHDAPSDVAAEEEVAKNTSDTEEKTDAVGVEEEKTEDVTVEVKANDEPVVHDDTNSDDAATPGAEEEKTEDVAMEENAVKGAGAADEKQVEGATPAAEDEKAEDAVVEEKADKAAGVADEENVGENVTSTEKVEDEITEKEGTVEVEENVAEEAIEDEKMIDSVEDEKEVSDAVAEADKSEILEGAVEDEQILGSDPETTDKLAEKDSSASVEETKIEEIPSSTAEKD